MKILVGICICLMIGTLSFGQKANWQNLDMAKDSVLGISTEKIYSKLTSKKATWVIVGVLDDGVDITHEDIRASLWQNPKEKKNLKDDDKNGYIDDLNGWNFIGSNRGNVQLDNLELTRQVRNGTKYFGGKDTATLSGNDRTLYNDWLKQKDDLRIKIGNSKTIIRNFKSFNSGLKAIVRTIASENPSLSDFENYKPKNPFDAGTVSYVISILKEGKNFTDFKEKLAKDALNFQNDIDYRLNVNYDPRSIVGDDYNNLNDKHYGNSDVTGADADHGTHVAGIIAADRNNGLGIKGIADHVKIMSVRTVPDGDERDKDVANAIRYAVDNGAKVINMSFGKAISPDKAVIDEAVKYAISKDVLLVHA
ncbi:MAG: peptidase S8, partial [Flavobacterium sp.]